jgi:hypothetical protein
MGLLTRGSGHRSAAVEGHGHRSVAQARGGHSNSLALYRHSAVAGVRLGRSAPCGRGWSVA